MQNNFNALYFPFKFGVFYLIMTNLWRWLFIVYNTVEQGITPMVKGLRLDLSAMSWVLIILFLPWLAFLISGKLLFRNIVRWMCLIFWLLISIIELSSILIYPEWGTTINYRAISYLMHPGEAWASVHDFISPIVVLAGVFLFFVGKKWMNSFFIQWKPIQSYRLQSFAVATLLLPLLIFGLRGGFQKLPIKPADTFYSGDMKNNFAAVNKVWYLGYSIIKNKTLQTSHSQSEIDNFRLRYKSQNCLSDTTRSWKNKNIVVLIMEGWSYDMVQYLGGHERITPHFDSLSRISLRFTNAFSTGFRTDQGLLSIISGIPSVGGFNMANQPEKVQYYPSIAHSMKEIGYKTSFIYGGDLNFSNLYTYLQHAKFDKIISEKDYSVEDNLTDWGVPDHIAASKAIEIMNGEHPYPFFSVVLFLSSHAPFEIPVSNELSNAEDIPTRYKSSVKYSDFALGLFFSKAQKMEWFNNTIFIITSDHGNTHTSKKTDLEWEKFRIPLIIFDPSSPNSTTNNIIPCNHYSLPYTLALKSQTSPLPFLFGHNIFCQDTSRVAYWSTDHKASDYSILVDDAKDINHHNADPALFSDMVKQWFNSLGSMK